MKKLFLIFLFVGCMCSAQTRPNELDIKNKRYIDPWEYGAKPNDSVDDSAAIRTCLLTAISGGSDVQFRPGDYDLTFSPFTALSGKDCKNITISGTGNTRFVADFSAGNFDVINATDTTNWNLEDVSIVGTNPDTSIPGANGISIINRSGNLHFRNLKISDMPGIYNSAGSYIDGGKGITFQSTSDNVENIRIENVDISSCSYGVTLEYDGQFSSVFLDNLAIAHVTHAGISMVRSTALVPDAKESCQISNVTISDAAVGFFGNRISKVFINNFLLQSDVASSPAPLTSVAGIYLEGADYCTLANIVLNTTNASYGVILLPASDGSLKSEYSCFNGVIVTVAPTDSIGFYIHTQNGYFPQNNVASNLLISQASTAVSMSFAPKNLVSYATAGNAFVGIGTSTTSLSLLYGPTLAETPLSFNAGYPYLYSTRLYVSAIEPVTGTWATGDVILNNRTAASATTDYMGWVCTQGGTFPTASPTFGTWGEVTP